MRDLDQLGQAIESLHSVRNREDIKRVYKKIHTLRNKLFGQLSRIKGFTSDELKKSKRNRILNQINEQCLRALNTVITYRIRVGFRPITKHEFESEVFFSLVDDITEADPVRGFSSGVPEATYRYEKRTHRNSVKARGTGKLETIRLEQAHNYANAAQKYPVARYTRNNGSMSDNGSLPVARYHRNASKLPKNFNKDKPGIHYLIPKNYQGTAF